MKIMQHKIETATSRHIQVEVICLKAISPEHQDVESDPPIAYIVILDPDTIYMHQSMKVEYKEEFKKAMKKELDDQYNKGNFSIIKRDKVPEGATILPAVWQMQRKRDIKTIKVKKYKARIKSKIYCRIVEDNSGALEISRINKYRPRNKSLNNRIHHFLSYVDTTKDIIKHPINTKDKLAYMLTMATSVGLMTKFRNIIMEW